MTATAQSTQASQTQPAMSAERERHLVRRIAKLEADLADREARLLAIRAGLEQLDERLALQEEADLRARRWRFWG